MKIIIQLTLILLVFVTLYFGGAPIIESTFHWTPARRKNCVVKSFTVKINLIEVHTFSSFSITNSQMRYYYSVEDVTFCISLCPYGGAQSPQTSMDYDYAWRPLGVLKVTKFVFWLKST